MKKAQFLQILSLSTLVLALISWKSKPSDCQNSQYILTQSQKYYTANEQWQQDFDLNIHIQEPRVGNPQRYTKLHIDLSNNYFEMIRNRDEHIEKRIMDANGNHSVTLDGKENFSDALKKKYRLYAERTQVSRNFYELLYSLPMSLNENIWANIESAEQDIFEGKPIYRIAIELKEPIVSKHISALISKDDYKILALEFNHLDILESEGEILKFEGEIDINGVKIPRIRHWYTKGTNEYLGSDIIVAQLE